MKYSFALAAAISAVAAQDISQLSQCGQSCIADMVRIATTQFGCAQDDTACYCTNADFGYGVRDCSIQACGADAPQIIEFGTNYCAAVAESAASAGATITASALTVLSSAAAEAGITSGGAEGGAQSTPVTTSPLETTITSDGSAIVQTTGFVTLFGPAGAAGSASSAASDAITSAESAAASASDAASSAIDSAESGASSAIDSAESGASSVANAASSALNSATGGSTGAAPIMTAAPMLAGAGLAALLFI